MCSTKSVVAGHAGPSLTLPSWRATTRAAARSLLHGISVNDVRPNELHSSTPRNSAPNPAVRVGVTRPLSPSRPSPESADPESRSHPVSAATSTSSAHTTHPHRALYMTLPPIPPPSVTRHN